MLQLRAKFEICVMSYSTFVMDRKFRWPLECLNYEALTCNLLLNLAISAGLITPLRVTDSQFKPSGGHWNFSAWKVSKYRVIPGPNTEKYEPEITPYLDTFHAVFVILSRCRARHHPSFLSFQIGQVFCSPNQVTTFCEIWRSSHLEFYKIDVLKNFAKYTRKVFYKFKSVIQKNHRCRFYCKFS